jgi:hypothetical protein
MNYSFYKILGFINSTATGHPHIKSFMMGDISEIDNFKQTLFPLCYLVPGEAVINVYGSATFNFNLIVIKIIVIIVMVMVMTVMVVGTIMPISVMVS